MENDTRRRFLLQLSSLTASGLAFGMGGDTRPADRPNPALAGGPVSTPVPGLSFNLAGYANELSVYPGEKIKFHIGDPAQKSGNLRCNVTIIRRESDFVHDFGDHDIAFHEQGPDIPERGCNWPGIPEFTVPLDWASGIYTARVSGGSSTAEIPFIVKKPWASISADRSILVVIPFATHLAYNAWGGKSLYVGEPRGTRLHSHRPTMLSPIPGDYDDLLRWINVNGYADLVSFGSSFDLQFDPQYLGQHNMMVSPWHDEYWSLQMRATVERFIANGGNVCFMSGNTCWWKVELEKDASTGAVLLTCRKDPASDYWHEIGMPESNFIGVSSLGGAAWVGGIDEKPAEPYKAGIPGHWLYAGSNVGHNEEFGTFYYPNDTIRRSVVGYETDAVDPYTPRNWVTLAYTGNLIKSSNQTCFTTHAWVALDPANNCGATYATANLGFYRRNGMVFAMGSVDWKSGLLFEPVVHRMTANLFDRLSQANPKSNLALAASPARIPNLSFEDWDASSTLPAGWTMTGLASCTAVRRASGTQSLLIITAAGEATLTLANLSLRAGCQYRLGVWASSDSGGQSSTASVSLLANPQGTASEVVTVALPGNSRTWTYYTQTGALAGSRETVVAGAIRIRIPPGYVLCLDDLRPENMNAVEKSWAGGISLINSSFEAGWDNHIPFGWNKEGAGPIGEGAPYLGGASLFVNGASGATWVTQRVEAIERKAYYRVGAWVHSSQRGVFLQLQSMDVKGGNLGGIDFVSAEHPGDGTWRYLTAVGRPDPSEYEIFFPRVKLFVSAGAQAHFKNVSVDVVGSCDDSGVLL